MLTPLVARQTFVGEQAVGLLKRIAWDRLVEGAAIGRKSALILRPQAVDDKARARSFRALPARLLRAAGLTLP